MNNIDEFKKNMKNIKKELKRNNNVIISIKNQSECNNAEINIKTQSQKKKKKN